jgi:hypothetical protein
MSTIKTTSAFRGAFDHFEPENMLDPVDQRRLRGQLEQIDYTAFAANQAILGQALGPLTPDTIKRLAICAAQARAGWARAAMKLAESGHPPSRAEIESLAADRAAFEEMREAYEAIRRMIERGYLNYRPAPA